MSKELVIQMEDFCDHFRVIRISNCDLGEPAPQYEPLLMEYQCYDYNRDTGIRTVNDGNTTIATIRSYALAYEEMSDGCKNLLGPTILREMREYKSRVMNPDCSTPSNFIYTTIPEREVARMKALIAEYAESNAPHFFIDMETDLRSVTDEQYATFIEVDEYNHRR